MLNRPRPAASTPAAGHAAPDRPAPGEGGGQGGRGGPQRALDARTLYLAAAEPLRVTSTGEALVVSRADGRVMRVPISRVMRVVCTDTADWSGAALALCMQRGVPLSWLDSRGEAQGHLWPQRARQVDLARALDVLASDSPDWSLAYDNWLRHQRLLVLQRWQGERGAAGSPVGEAEWQCAKRQYAYRDEIPEQLPALLHGMAAALVVARLSDCGLLPHYWCSVGEPIELAADITRLVWAEMNLCAGPLAAAIDQPQEAAAIFERWAGTCAGAVHLHLANLRAHALRELAA
jgi:CRISPR associated protein Cas1